MNSPVFRSPSVDLREGEKVEKNESSKNSTSEAMVHSSMAAKFMQQQHYEQALSSYQQALTLYRRDYAKGAMVDKCNAAATLHNMGLLHKRCKRLHQAISCLEEAEALYRECSAQAQPQQSGDGVCLEYLLAETLQNRANLHSKYERDISAAIDCHEEVVAMLLDLGCSPYEEITRPLSPQTIAPAAEVSVKFVRINDDQRVNLLSISLRSLGNLYLQQGEQDDALGAYQEALDMMRCQQLKHPDAKLQKKISSTLLSMACVYFSQNELDQAVAALDDCISSHNADETHPDVLTALNNLGLAYERKGDLDKGMHCFEDLLGLKQRQLGESHVEVAETLIMIAKILERQGNMSAALERYQDSLKIYREAISHEDPAFSSIVTEVLSKISALSTNRGFSIHAASAYQKALPPRNSQSRTKQNETRLDEAKVFLQLAKSFEEKESYQAAKDCLTEVRHILRPLSESDGRVEKLEKEVSGLEAILKIKSLESSCRNKSLIKVETKQEDDSLDPPLVLVPSVDSHVSPSGLVGEDGDQEPTSPLLLQSIKVAASETETSIELQCVSGAKSDSSSSGSASTRSETPDSSLDEPNISPKNAGGIIDDLDPSQDQYPDPDLALAVLDALEEDDASSVPDCHTHDGQSKESNLFYAESSEYSEFSLPTITPVVSDALESSAALNKSSQDITATENHKLSSSNLETREKQLRNRGIHDVDAELIQRRSNRMLRSEALDCVQSQASVDGEAQGTPLSSRFHQFQESEYESFGEGSMLDNDNELTEFDNSEFEMTDVDTADLEYTTEEEQPGGPEDIYWDEEENREVHLTESQFSDADEEDSRDTYSFQTPLGLERRSDETHNFEINVSASCERTPPPIQKSPHKSLGPNFDPKASPRHRLVKALSRPFRRKGHGMTTKLEPTPEDAVPEIMASLDDRAPRKLQIKKGTLLDDETTTSGAEEFSGPIEFVQLGSLSFDDNVSQITVRREDFLSRNNDNKEKWWSEGWFPSVFADIAEEFLSAKSIHNRSRKPHDDGTYSTSSGDDSDPFDDLQSEGELDEAKAELGADDPSAEMSASLNPNYEVRNGAHAVLDVSTPEVPTSERGPNIEGIVGEVNSTLWKPTAMVGLPRKRMSESPGMQLRIESLENIIKKEKNISGYCSENVAGALVSLALIRVECGDTNLAVNTLLEALSIQKAIRDPLAMSRSLHVLADIYSSQDEYDLALACYCDVQHIERRLFGPDHPETANTLNRIGRVYANQGLFHQAMEKHQQALQVLKACVGEDLSHPAVSQTLIYIGEVYYRERNSLSTIRDNADDYKKFIETGMLDVIARAHEDRGSYKIALGFMEEKLQLIKNENSNFPQGQLAQILFNVGNLSCKSGVFLEAIDYYQQALEIQVRLGCTDVEIATAKVLIGTVEYHLGQYRKSLNLLEAALLVFEKEFGEDHEIVADTLHRIALVKSELWHLDDAMENLVRALQLQIQLFGDHDLEVYKTRLEMCWIEVNQCFSDDVASHIKGIMRKQQDLVGDSHPIIADTMLMLGKVLLLSGKSSKGIKVLKESLKMRERFLGRDHPLQAETFHLIALEGIRRERYLQALGMCHSVLNIRRETLGERHLDVASTLESLGRCYVGTGKFKEANDCFNEALKVAQLSVGENHPCVGDIYVGKGVFHLRKCQFDAAKEAIEKGITIYETVGVDDEHIRMKEAEKLLERVERDEMLCV